VLSFIHGSDREKPKELFMKLYFHPKSPNATAVLAVAYELGIALDLQEVNLPGGEQRQPAFLKINPNGKVPALEDGDFCLVGVGCDHAVFGCAKTRQQPLAGGQSCSRGYYPLAALADG
jgi:Glutathione S-transferase, N-terminal domain